MALKIRHWLACGVALVALPSVAVAQSAGAGAGVESVTVTGSRVISDAANSPTPLTIISAAQLEATTPTNIPDGLNKLPVFQGSQTINRAGDGTINAASNVLNLRQFGAQRTLVLLDGHRAPPSNSDGTVDIDTLPEMLVSRVDVVTGGASAVYGSDAVSGVVNFILDKKFTGLKIDTHAGISNYGDSMGYKFGLAAGTELFGGRGHIEASMEYRHRDGINTFDRPYGPSLYAQVGSGSVANPFAYIKNGRRPNSTFGGLVQGCVPACPLANQQQFITNGVLGPFNPGVAGAHDAAGNVTTGTGNENSGGDGAYSPYGTLQDANRQGTIFTRFSYDVSDSTHFYVQGIASESYANGWHFPMKLTPGAGQADLFYKNNPYLTAAVQTQLGNNGTNVAQVAAANPAVQPANTFQLGEFLEGLGQNENNGNLTVNRLLNVQAGLDGTFMDGRFSWNLFYQHGENRLALDLVNNQNYQKLYAASDAVLNASGQAVCYAATQAATAAAYASCVPINPFGPTAVTRTAFNYFAETTNNHQSNILDNVGAAVSGTVFEGWAGPIKAALSSEARFNDYTVTTNAPITTVDCTGLRLCSSLLPLYAQPVLAPVHAANNVWEVAGEAEIPLLKDMPLVRSLRHQPGRPLHRLFGVGLGSDLEDRLQLECRRLLALPRHHLDRHPRAHAGRPVPSADAGAERLHRLQRPSYLHQQHHLPSQPGQSRPGAGSVAHLYGGCGVDAGLHPGPDDVAGLFPHPHEEPDRQHHSQQQFHPGALRSLGRNIAILRALSASAAFQQHDASQLSHQDLQPEPQYRIGPGRRV